MRFNYLTGLFNMFFNKSENEKNDDWQHGVKQVFTELFRFEFMTRYKNYKLTKSESEFLIKIILENTEQEKIEASNYD